MLNTLRTSLADVLTSTSSDKVDASSEKVCTVIVSIHSIHLENLKGYKSYEEESLEVPCFVN
jgi:hypothetical protein